MKLEKYITWKSYQLMKTKIKMFLYIWLTGGLNWEILMIENYKIFPILISESNISEFINHAMGSKSILRNYLKSLWIFSLITKKKIISQQEKKSVNTLLLQNLTLQLFMELFKICSISTWLHLILSLWR